MFSNAFHSPWHNELAASLKVLTLSKQHTMQALLGVSVQQFKTPCSTLFGQQHHTTSMLAHNSW